MEKQILNKLRKIMNKYDLMSIYLNKKVNFDEYDPEIKEIYNLFNLSKSTKDFRKIVYKTFQKMFGNGLAKKEKDYMEIAKELYNLLKNETSKI